MRVARTDGGGGEGVGPAPAAARLRRAIVGAEGGGRGGRWDRGDEHPWWVDAVVGVLVEPAVEERVRCIEIGRDMDDRGIRICHDVGIARRITVVEAADRKSVVEGKRVL